jgi:hypothetical protein
VATWNGTTMQIYVDGVSRATKAFSGPADTTPDPLYLASEKGAPCFGVRRSIAEHGDLTATTRVEADGDRLLVLGEAWRGRRILATGGFAMQHDGTTCTPG